uniref:NERD domain-containing protein n=1 Tax=Curvibacter symbiont subsp. Hydra magnipapillata TaxID=667019 RepID=C9YCX4_CURXX|nr:hypothetical protein Csp_C25530 [Curvibacter putative symbiont of Hydra magnipapillata]
MGQFIEAVQKDEVISPLRRNFNVNNWNKAFDKLGSDEADTDLYKTGLKVLAKSKSIRASLTATVREDINAPTKLRAFVAIVNHNFLAVARRTRAALQVAAQSNTRVLTCDLSAVRLPLMSGDSFSPDEIIQSTVDAVQIPIKVILGKAPSLSGSPKFSALDWDSFNVDFNLGQAYFSMEELWDDCIWNEFCPTEDKGQTTYSPADHFWLRLRAASRARQDNLNLQFFAISEKMESQIGMAGRLGFRDIQKIEKIGRKQVIRLTPLNEPTAEGAHLASMFAYACEPFYKDLLNEPILTLANGTINELLRAWAVVVLCANTLRTQLENASFSADSDNPNSWLPRHAPVLQRDALTRAIVDSLSTTYPRASAFLEFLTFKGTEGQELWAQPLVPVGDNVLAPIFAVTSHPNLRRVVDVWLRQLNLDLGSRGLAFERELRARIQREIIRSPLLKEAKVLNTGLKFRPPDFREEEIDLVVIVGDLVILGEAKCSVTPTEAKQYARHREIVINATAQIQRKSLAISTHRTAFQLRLKELGIELPNDFRILPVVIMNDAIHSGMAVADVPVIDEHILSVFFTGEIIDIAERLANGSFHSVRKRVLYANIAEAAESAESFFRAPPQFEVFINGVTKREISIPAVCEEDWCAIYTAYECIPSIANRDELF